MHLSFDAASAVVSNPAPPNRAAQISLRMDRIGAGNYSVARRLPGHSILAWRDHRMGISGSNRLVAFAGVIRPICGNVADDLIERDLVQEFGQHGSITDVPAGDFGCPNFQRFPVDTYVYLAPYAAFRTAMFACIPLAFTLGLDPRAIDKEIQRASTATIRQAHVQRFLAAAKSAEVRCRPIEPDKPQQALNKPSCLAEWHAKKDRQRLTRLNSRVTEFLLPTALAVWRRCPHHLRIKPDRQRSAPLQAVIVR